MSKRELEKHSSAAPNGAGTRKGSRSFFEFTRGQIAELRDRGKYNTARNYQSALNSLSRYLAGKDLALSEVTAALVEAYGAWLTGSGVCSNTLSFYMRTLRASYNKAVERGLVAQAHPFRNVYTGIDKTHPRAITEKSLKELHRMDLPDEQALARDLFLFCYAMRGMSFVDVAFLRKADIRGGYIIYSRHKTGSRLSIRLEELALRIIRRYRDATANSPYVFPLLGEATGEAAYQSYQKALRAYNRQLARLSSLVGVHLSSHMARHSWASAAYAHEAAFPVISEALGHTSERVTRIYVRAAQNNLINDLNRKIVRRLTRSVSS